MPNPAPSPWTHFEIHEDGTATAVPLFDDPERLHAVFVRHELEDPHPGDVLGYYKPAHNVFAPVDVHDGTWTPVYVGEATP